MPRTIEGITYDAIAWDVREFRDETSSQPPGVPVQVQQSVKMDWETSAARRQIFARLTMEFVNRNSSTSLLRVVLVGQFSVNAAGRDALHGDMAGLPPSVWIAMAREVYDTARGLVLAQCKNLKQVGIPTVPDEAFSVGLGPDVYGLSPN